jgi:hypothetical protein
MAIDLGLGLGLGLPLGLDLGVTDLPENLRKRIKLNDKSQHLGNGHLLLHNVDEMKGLNKNKLAEAAKMILSLNPFQHLFESQRQPKHSPSL